MYTREALEARYANRAEPAVWHALNRWWALAMEQNDMDPESQSMPKGVYIALYVRVCKALLDEDDEWDEEEAVRLTEESWAEDSRGKPQMNRSMFNDGLFEVRVCSYALCVLYTVCLC